MLQRVCRVTLPVVVLLAALAVYRLAVGSSTTVRSNKLERATPWLIAPQHNEPLVATDDELLKVLARVQPPADPVNTNNFVHALRLWGATATFDDAARPSGAQMQAYFLDDRVFQQFAGKRAPAIFERSRDGYLRARSYDDGLPNRTTSSYHTDDLLATLGETGATLDTQLTLRDGAVTVRDLVEGALAEFTLARHEVEWSAISYARYVFPEKMFRNKFGETITVDELVDRLMQRPPGVGPCNGLHRLEALVVLYRADEQAKVLSPRTKAKMLAYMRQMSDLLVAAQTPEGYWTRNWPKGAAGQSDAKATVYDRLLVTGHQLEWLALAPAEVQPPREHIVRAARWTVQTILEMSDKQLADHYGPFSHAARALCLWRGHEAADIWAKRPAATNTDAS